VDLHKDENRPELMLSLIDADKRRRSLKDKWPRYSQVDVAPGTPVARGLTLSAVEIESDARPLA
jgi:hypothetical protein